MKKVLWIVPIFFIAVSCTHNNRRYKSFQDFNKHFSDENVSSSENPRVLIKTNKGEIVLELFPKKAPITVQNFLKYVKNDFYKGTIFHRVIKGFMVQGGGFVAGMKEKETNNTIKNEADNGLTNNRGTVAMARTQRVHSASSQFFINLVNNSMLNHRGKSPDKYGYCVFGKVEKGMDVVDSISRVATGKKANHGDVPKEDIVILSATVIENKS